MNRITQIRFVWKPIVFLTCLVPFAIIAARVFGVYGALGANPIEEVMDWLGNWGLRFIMIALAVTPLRKITGWNWLIRFRRMLGLFAFFYILMHFATWFVLDRELYLGDIAEDIAKRPFITLGMVALILLIAMAVTSTNGMRRRLGKRWDNIHKGVYVVGVLGVWHYWWQVKSDITEPLIYAVILAALLAYRVYSRYGHKRTKAGGIPNERNVEAGNP